MSNNRKDLSDFERKEKWIFRPIINRISRVMETRVAKLFIAWSIQWKEGRKRRRGRAPLIAFPPSKKTDPLARGTMKAGRVVNNKRWNRISGFTASFLKRAKAKDAEKEGGITRFSEMNFCRPNFRQRGIKEGGTSSSG